MENFERIQKYLLNQMSEEEKRDFEEEVRRSSALAEELELQRFELETIDQLEEDALRAKARELRAEMIAAKPETKVKKLKPFRPGTTRWIILAVAASIALLIGFFFLQTNRFSASEAIALGYEASMLDYGAPIARSDDDTDVFDLRYLQILRDRNEAQAGEAIDYFARFSTANELVSIDARMNLGHAYMLNKEFEKAIDIFRELENSSEVSTRKKEEAAFFRALAMLGAGETDQGISLLEQIEKGNGRFAPIAKDILAKKN